MSIGAFGENFPYTNFHDLNMDWILKVIKEFNQQYPQVMEEILKKVPKPFDNPNGNYGEFLMSDGAGGTKWEDISTTYAEIIYDAVTEWLDEHPEATTTVEDGSITIEKLNYSLAKYVGRIGKLNLDFIGRTIRLDDYKSGQGMCVNIENDTPVIYSARYNYDLQNELAIITKMDFEGNVIATSAPLSIGHASDITFNSTINKLFVAGEKQVVWRINPETLQLEETVPTSLITGIVGIAYDKDNNQYFLIGQNKHIYRASPDFLEIRDDLTFDYDIINQSLEYHDGKLYIPDNSPEVIYTIDTENDYNVSNISLLETFASGYYPLGELQCISIYNDNGDFIVSGKPRGYNPDNPSLEVGIGTTCFCKGNIITNTSYTPRPSNSLASFVNYRPVYVVSSSTAFRPDGTAELPFKTLAEGLFCLEAPLMKPDRVELHGDFSTEDLVLNNISCGIGADTADNKVNVRSIYASLFIGTIRHINIVNTTAGSFHVIRSRADINDIDCSDSDITTKILKAEVGSIIISEGTSIINNHQYSIMYRSILINTNGGENAINTYWSNIGSLTSEGNISNGTLTLTDSPTKFNNIMVLVQIYSYGKWRNFASIIVPINEFISTTGTYFNGYTDIAGTKQISGLVQYENNNVTVNGNCHGESPNWKITILGK